MDEHKWRRAKACCLQLIERDLATVAPHSAHLSGDGHGERCSTLPDGADPVDERTRHEPSCGRRIRLDSRSEPTASSHDVGEHCVTKSCSVLTSWVTLAFSGHDSWSTADQLIDSRETEVRTHARSVKDKLNIDASCRSTVEARLDPQMADSSYWSCSAVNAVTTAIELLTTALVY